MDQAPRQEPIVFLVMSSVVELYLTLELLKRNARQTLGNI